MSDIKTSGHLTRAQVDKRRQQAVDRAYAAARAWQWHPESLPAWAYPDWIPAGTVRMVRLANMGEQVYGEAA